MGVGGASTSSRSQSGQEVPPSYEGGEPSAGMNQHTESERDDFGTIVTEITTVTTSTRRRYRVEGA